MRHYMGMETGNCCLFTSYQSINMASYETIFPPNCMRSIVMHIILESVSVFQIKVWYSLSGYSCSDTIMNTYFHRWVWRLRIHNYMGVFSDTFCHLLIKHLCLHILQPPPQALRSFSMHALKKIGEHGDEATIIHVSLWNSLPQSVAQLWSIGCNPS